MYRVKYSADYIFTEVIQQCALEKDLELFDAGDKTEVGEKGLTLRRVKMRFIGCIDRR